MPSLFRCRLIFWYYALLPPSAITTSLRLSSQRAVASRRGGLEPKKIETGPWWRREKRGGVSPEGDMVWGEETPPTPGPWAAGTCSHVQIRHFTWSPPINFFMMEVLCQVKFSTRMHGGGSVKKQLRLLQSNRGRFLKLGPLQCLYYPRPRPFRPRPRPFRPRPRPPGPPTRPPTPLKRSLVIPQLLQKVNHFIEGKRKTNKKSFLYFICIVAIVVK